MQKELELAKKAAIEMGKVQLEHFRKAVKTIRKSAKELVSEVDVACEKLAKELLSGEYPVCSEEMRNESELGDTFWVVDPVDGTHNYISGLPMFGVSLALVTATAPTSDDRAVFGTRNRIHSSDSQSDFLVKGNPFKLGVIYLPYFDELYWAVEGKGAFMNGSKLRVSNNPDLAKSMVLYDNQFHLQADAMKFYEEIVDRSFTSRITGCAVFDLAMIASGRIDARVFNRTKPFDFAAGALLVKEAGGKITDFAGKEITLETTDIVASNSKVHAGILKLLGDRA